jgi:chaperonin cofactor prefoldin
METQLPEAYALLLARIVALESQVAAIREEVDELRAKINEHWLGGTD